MAFLRVLCVHLGRLVTVVAILGSLGYALYYAQASPDGARLFPIARIEFTGTAQMDQEALTALLRRSLPPNLLQVDLPAVRRTVESEPWVQSARVRRVLPDRLVIDVVERQPAAVATIDSELYVVDQDGTILDRYSASYDGLERPIVKGLVNLARENARDGNAARMRAYLRVVSALEKSPKGYLAYISEIDVENPQRVALIPNDAPVPVFVGDTAFLERYETFLSSLGMYRQLTEKYGPIEYVDVTFGDRIIFHTAGAEQAEMIPAEVGPAG
jgi:cell division septal protein FtsQ